MSEKITQADIIIGITPVDDKDHVVVGRYKTHAGEPEAATVEVVEVVNRRLPHTKIEGGNPLGRMAVFSRIISESERQKRIEEHQATGDEYINSVLGETFL